MKRGIWIAAAAMAVACGLANVGSAQKKAPAVTGAWSGTWGVYTPPPANAPEGKEKPSPYTLAQRQMDCKVEMKGDGKWEATFEGECGRPYKYTIKMSGRQSGEAVLFQGSADLGPQDGGVYDWIGRATEKEFVGFFSSGKYTGAFRLDRPKSVAAAK
ncbi:MAG: hypothetical protein FJX77_12150 [Armatimonadetes bacterium]|nr:hypothetical protein [Armatimonadota bacterium]